MSSALFKLEPSSLREQAADAIRAGLGVSATPVREAMLDLANEGLVEPVRNRGFRVVELTDDDLDEILALRVLLEVPSAGRVAGTLAPPQVERLAELVAETEVKADAFDVPGFLTADRAFHLALLEPLGSRRLVDLVAMLRDQTRLYGLPSLISSGILETAAADHRAILEAIVRGKAEEAMNVMR